MEKHFPQIEYRLPPPKLYDFGTNECTIFSAPGPFLDPLNEHPASGFANLAFWPEHPRKILSGRGGIFQRIPK